MGCVGWGWVHTPLFCQIYIKSALNWLESKTKIFGAAYHPQNLDSLLHLKPKIQSIFLIFVFLCIFLNAIEMFWLLM